MYLTFFFLFKDFLFFSFNLMYTISGMTEMTFIRSDKDIVVLHTNNGGCQKLFFSDYK